MNRNQIIAVSACGILLIVIYLFGKTTKPKDESFSPFTQGHVQPRSEDSLNIEDYIGGVNSKITDAVTKGKIENFTDTKNYRALAEEYRKLDKPLAVAYYRVKLAEEENKLKLYVDAGDYNSMLLQTAPDEKSKKFLSTSAIQCYQKAVALDSTQTDNRIRLAGAYVEDGEQPMQGIMILLNIVQKDSNNIDAQLMLGRFALMSGQFDKAVARFQKILYLQPENSEALFLEAEAFDKQGNRQKAIELLERCEKAVKEPGAKKEIQDYIERLKKPNS